MKPADYMAYLHPYSHQSMAMDDFLLGIPNTMAPNQYAGPGGSLAASFISQRSIQTQSSMDTAKHSHNTLGSNF